MRHGLGPVFGNEWLTTSRRWQVYAGRALFVSALLVGLWSVWVSRVSGQQIPTIQLEAIVGQGFFMAIVFTQMTLILLIAPAATAGSICQDRSSGKLIQLLGTDLSDSEIVLGKLAARILPVLGLACCCATGSGALLASGRRRSARIGGGVSGHCEPGRLRLRLP